MHGRLRFLLPLATWSCAVAAAWWLYRGGIGSGDAVGVAQVKEYKVAPYDLGRLASLEVVEGQRVAPGLVVARFETGLIEKEISIAQVRLRQMASEARALGVSLDIGLIQAERNFESEIGTTEVELQAAQSSFARDQAELNKVLEELQVQRDLVKGGLAKADRRNDLELRSAALEEAVRMWPARLDALETSHRSAATRLNEWRRTHAGTPEGGSRAAQLQPLYEKVREQQELIELLETRHRHAALVAPSDAYVSKILARPGDVVKAGDPVLMLVEARPRQVIAYLDERRGNTIYPGAKVRGHRRVKPRAQFEGTVVTGAGNVSELPVRFWLNPSIPSWGREVYIDLPPTVSLDPGEEVDISWPDGPASAHEVAAEAAAAYRAK